MGVVVPTAQESLPLAVAAIRSSISAGVVVEDRDGNVAIANTAAQRMLGPYVATSPGWRAAPGWELTDADGGALTHETLAPSLARARKAAVREQLIVVRAPSGAQAWLTLDAEPVLDEHGQLEGVVITITDRTGVMQVVRELTANHAELSHVVDAGHDGYFIRDFATGTTVHSARMNALVGLPAIDTEAGLDDWRQRIHPDDSDRLARAYQAVTSGAVERFDLTYRVRCEDGAWRWVRSRGKVVARRADDTPLRLICTVTDVQEFKDLETSLASSERRLREASTAGAVGLWELDLASQRSWRTERHAEIFGVPDGPWSLAAFREAVVPEDRELADRAIEVGRRAGDMHLEVRIRRGDGRLRWIEAAAKLVFDDQGGARLIGNVRDITERKWVEMDLERTMRAKAARVAELEELLKATPLTDLLTTCMHCKCVRDDAGAWQHLDAFLASRTGMRFSHGVCPTCFDLHYPGE